MYTKERAVAAGFDYGGWHNDPNCKVEIINHGGRAYLHCSACRVLCELEASTTEGAGGSRLHVRESKEKKQK